MYWIFFIYEYPILIIRILKIFLRRMISNQLSISKRVYQIPLIVQFSWSLHSIRLKILHQNLFDRWISRWCVSRIRRVHGNARASTLCSASLILHVCTRGRSVGPLSRRRELTGRLTCELLRANYCNRNGRKHSTRRLMDQYVSRMSSFVYGPPFTIIYLKIRWWQRFTEKYHR